MSNKSYQTYMQLLRSREVRPAFSKIEDIIESASVTKTSIWRSAIAALLLVAAGSFVWSRMDQSDVHVASSAKGVTVSSVIRTVRFTGDLIIQTRKNQNLLPSKEGTRIAEQPALAVSINASTCTNDVPDELSNEKQLPIETCNPLPVAAAAMQIGQEPKTLQAISLESEDASKWSAFIGGSAARQLSAESMLRANSVSDLFAGVGYRVSKYFIVSLRSGEMMYLLPSTSSVMTYRDTTFEHDGQTYHNVIGSLVPTSTSSQTRVYWLGGSVQYSFGNVWRPCAEIGGAASQQGAMLHESIGVATDISESLGVDLFAQGAQLNASGTWLTKLGLSLALDYHF